MYDLWYMPEIRDTGRCGGGVMKFRLQDSSRVWLLLIPGVVGKCSSLHDELVTRLILDSEVYFDLGFKGAGGTFLS